jgi:translocation and assembly module TamB
MRRLAERLRQLPERGRGPGPRDFSGCLAGPEPGGVSRAFLLRLLLAGGLIGALALTVRIASRDLLNRIYGHWRPRLELQVGRVMGRPLQLGPLEGLAPDGLRIGPSRFLPGPKDGSTVSVRAMTVFIDPVASWRQRQLILDLSFEAAEADLRRNAAGQIWVLGSLPPGPEPPPLELRMRFLQPASVRLWGLGADPARPISLHTAGQVNVGLRRRALDLRARAWAPGQRGSAVVSGDGNWQRRRWQALIEPRGFSLQTLRPLIPLPGRIDGHADGRVRLSLDRGSLSCGGGLRLADLRWTPAGGGAPLQVDAAPLDCRGRQLLLAESRWRYAGWAGRLAGRVDGQQRLAARLEAVPPRGNPLGLVPLRASLQGRWRGGVLELARLDGSRGASWLRARGVVGRRLALDGGWSLAPRELPGGARLPDWLAELPLLGSLRLDGTLRSPRLAVQSAPADLPLVGPWQASLLWSEGLLRLQRFESAHLRAAGVMPLALRAGRGLVRGDLNASLVLSDYPLQRLDPVVATRLRGLLDVRGSLAGPLEGLRPDLDLLVREPGAGPLWLRERWRGRLQASALPFGPARRASGGGRLSLVALAPAPAGRIEAWLDQSWMPVRIDLERGGSLRLTGRPENYRWQARALPLAGLNLATGPRRRFQPLQGLLSGEGSLGLTPLAFQGRVRLDQPLFLGIGGRRIDAKVRYADRRYAVAGAVETLDRGRVDAQVEGTWAGPFRAAFQARSLTAALFRQFQAAWPVWLGGAPPLAANAKTLGSQAILTLGRSLDDQLLVLQAALAELLRRDEALARLGHRELLQRLQSRLDADLVLSGPDLASARADLTARGYLWLSHLDRDQVLAARPLELRLSGAILRGEGEFELSGLSLALLSLLTPVPESLRGQLAVAGRYRLGGKRPELELELALREASLGDRALQLERGRVELQDDGLRVDLALRAAGAANSLDLAGTVPLDSRSEGLELRLASRGDGLRFLTRLAGSAVAMKRGSTDMQLLIRGSLADPIANGFLRLRGGEMQFIGQTLREVEATVLFDFEQLLLQNLSARVGPRGRISGEGRLGLVRPLDDQPTLAVLLEKVPFRVPRLDAVGDGRLRLAGSLVQPRLGGDVAIRDGSLNASPGQLAAGPAGSAPDSGQQVRPVSFNQLIESKWDFSQPLVLLGPDRESATAESLRQAIPRAPWLSFEDMVVRLGPDLRVTIGNVGSFRTGGRLRITGRLDPTLQASGVVKLLGGRLNLFTTSFSLDPDAPNVAVFTPSLGLVPYLDIALRTRVSDSLSVIGPSGIAGPGGSNLSVVEGQGGFSRLNQLKLVLVTVAVSGPADRIADNLRFSSNPPLPQERLVALIGGNSLAGLSGGQAGTALATVLGQSLLSPLLSSLSDAFGQRVSFALYPTYVNPSLSTREERRSSRVPPQLVFGAEVGYDINDRLNASVLAAPNRSDVPPQLTINYKASETLTLEGSIDTEGLWQGLLRVFFRF